MYAIGDKVKVVKSKELQEWKNGKEVVGRVGIVTMAKKIGDKVIYFLDDNKYHIDFSGNSLRHTKEPVSKGDIEVAGEVKPGSTPAMPKLPEFLTDMLKDLEKMSEDLEETSDKLDKEMIMALGDHMVSHCKRIKKLEDSNTYLGIAVWVLVAYNVFTTIISLLIK